MIMGMHRCSSSIVAMASESISPFTSTLTGALLLLYFFFRRGDGRGDVRGCSVS